MLSKRLRRRLRQIDDGPVASVPASEREERPERTCEPLRAVHAALSRERLTRGGGVEATPAPSTISVAGGPLEDLVPGEAVETANGSYWRVAGHAREMLPHGDEVLERFRALTGLLGTEDDGPLAGLRGLPPTQIVLLDTETAGLSSAPIFLVGLIVWETDAAAEALALQLFARDYAEERAILAATAELLRGRRALMTYNGRSFDLPMLRERMVYHGLGDCPEPPAHMDLLHAIRARFRGRWENCRLQTLEKHLCGRSRVGDIEGAEIPDAWHEFVHSGDAGRMAQVMEHNRLDLITMLEVLPHLQGPCDDA